MKRVFVIFCFVVVWNVCFSQVVADFQPQVSAACANANILFTNTTTGCTSPATFYWQSGSGASSILENPTFSYTNGGTYTVSLTVTCNGQQYSVSKQIIIYNLPKAEFVRTHSAGCVPTAVNFTDLSTQGDAPISTYLWTFNDGNTSNQKNPTNTFNVYGIFTVTLHIIDEHNCMSTATEVDMVTINDNPIVNFSAVSAQNCYTPFPVTFNPQISIYNNLTYTATWDYGDGTAKGPSNSHTYTNFGHYNVSLSVTDAAGCSTTITKNDFIIIDNIPAAFFGKDTICKNSPEIYTNATTFNCQWDYDGQISTANSITLSYPTGGTHYVTLTTDPNGLCENKITFPIFVEDVTASFMMQPNQTVFCKPSAVGFINTSSSNAIYFNYSWMDPVFGKLTSQLKDPSVFLSEGNYQFTFTVATSHNCQSTFTGPQFIVLNREINFDVISDFCVPTTGTFVYSNFTFPYSDVVSSSWQINGLTGSQTINPGNSGYVQTVLDPDEINATLYITDNYGCQYVKQRYFEFGTHYKPLILDVQPPGGLDAHTCWCDGWKVLVKDRHDTCGYNCKHGYVIDSTGAFVPDGIHYTKPFAYSALDSCVREFIFVHHGCQTTVTIDTIIVDPPKLDSLYAINSCGNMLHFDFEAIATRVDNYYWKISQILPNNVVVLLANATTTTNLYSFDFPTSGEYLINLSVKNDSSGCICSTHTSVIVDAPQAAIYYSKDTVCVGGFVIFEAHNLSTTGISNLFWDFDNGQTSNKLKDTITFNAEGLYNVTLIIWDGNNCPDTAKVQILVPQINLSFATDNQQACIGATLDIWNTTQTEDPISEQNITWIISPGTYIMGSDTITQTFPDAGNYSVALSVISKHGCYKYYAYNNFITISDVDTNFSIIPDIACVGENVLFYSEENTAGATYNWNFGNGANILFSSNNAIYQYPAGGYYDVSLTVQNALGCKRTVSRENAIRVEEVHAYYTPSQNYFSCYPAIFEVSPIVTYVPDTMMVSYFWNFGTTENSALLNPIYLFNFPGTFNVQFTVTTPNGCSDTASHLITVNGPTATLLLSDTIVCIGDAVNFEITNLINVNDYLCVVGDGTSYKQTSFSHTYTYYPPGGILTINLKLYSYEGIDTCQVLIKKDIYVENPIADFKIFDNQLNEINNICSPFDANLNSNSQNDFTRNWLINGLNIGNNTNQKYIFNNATQSPETYHVTLQISSEHGCPDEMSKEILIYPKPVLITSNNRSICPDDTLQIWANGATSYLWSPSYNISDTTIKNPLVFPLEDAEYQVVGTNQYDCKDTSSIIVLVQDDVFTDISASDFTINIGECVEVSLIPDQNNTTVQWLPDYQISCTDCQDPTLCPQYDTTYFVTVSDSLQCFTNKYGIHITVRRIFTIDVPNIFTPLSGDENSIVYVRGIGIEKLLSFRIFNRWGEQIFITDDINVGWDGTFRGVMQNIENYAYTVEAKMINGEIVFKKGILMLVK